MKSIGIVIWFVLTMVLMLFDPMGLNAVNESGNQVSLMPLLYVIPFVVVFWFAYVRPVLQPADYSAKSLQVAKNKKVEFWKSIIRHAITIVGSILALGINVPYLDGVRDLLRAALANFDVVVDAVMQLFGVAMILWGIIKDKFRFGERNTLIEARKV